MADIGIYQISVVTYIGGLTVLGNILRKAKLHPDAETFPSARLIEDMQPLTFHVQSVTKTVSRSLSRLLETEVETWDEDETTLNQLIERADKCLALLRGLDPKVFEGREKTIITLPAGTFTGTRFILGFGAPNLFFHLNMVYAILRMKGVPIGKGDYLEPWHNE